MLKFFWTGEVFLIVQNLLVCKLIKIYHSVFWLWDMGAYSGKAKVQQNHQKRVSQNTQRKRERKKHGRIFYTSFSSLFSWEILQNMHLVVWEILLLQICMSTNLRTWFIWQNQRIISSWYPKKYFPHINNIFFLL